MRGDTKGNKGKRGGLPYETVVMLAEAAKKSAGNSYSPYSGFIVGAALLTADEKVYTGCNVENAAFSTTVCAERTALVKAVSEGERGFSAIAVYGRMKDGPETARPVYPCGVCLQSLIEFCDPEGFIVISSGTNGNYEVNSLIELLPKGFGPESLKQGPSCT